MTIVHRTVRTIQVPEEVHAKEERLFLRELESHMKGNRPQIVLDCSRVRLFDKCVVRLLLHTLEEALKRKGDVRLAGISGQGAAILEATGACRLFDVFETSAEAVDSFHHIPAHGMLGHSAGHKSRSVAESAA